jgi:hypothetical protein
MQDLHFSCRLRGQNRAGLAACGRNRSLSRAAQQVLWCTEPLAVRFVVSLLADGAVSASGRFGGRTFGLVGAKLVRIVQIPTAVLATKGIRSWSLF